MAIDPHHLPEEAAALRQMVLQLLQLVEDKDRKLILTLINIDKLRQSDLFFGVHAMLDCLAGLEQVTEFTPSTRWEALVN